MSRSVINVNIDTNDFHLTESPLIGKMKTLDVQSKNRYIDLKRPFELYYNL